MRESNIVAPHSNYYEIYDDNSHSFKINNQLDHIHQQSLLYAEGDKMPSPPQNVLTVGPPQNGGNYLKKFNIKSGNKGFRVMAFNKTTAFKKISKNLHKNCILSINDVLYKNKNNKLKKLYQ